MDEPSGDYPLLEEFNRSGMTSQDVGPEAAGHTTEITWSKCYVVWQTSESNPNLRPDAEGKDLMKGKEPMHVPHVVLNETREERFLFTPWADIWDQASGIEKEEANRMMVTNGVMSWKNTRATQSGR